VRHSILLLFIILLLTVSCVRQQAPVQPEISPPEPEEVIVPELIPAPVVEPEDTPEPVEEEPEESEDLIDEKLKPLINAWEKIRSYSYYYTTQEDPQGDTYYIKDNLIKIRKYQVNTYNKETYIDTVYLNVTGKTAVGYCENYKIGVCEDPNEKVLLEYDDYYVTTPHDWILSITKGKINSSETFDQRKVLVVDFSNDLVEGRMWVDSFFGVAHRIELYDGSRYNFVDMVFNPTQEENMVHENIIEGD